MAFSFTEDILCELTPEQLEKLKKQYITPKLVKLFEDKQVLDLCDSFFKNNLNACITAKSLFMHRNTLNYRLKKIYNITGLDLKNFEDAFVFKILLKIFKPNE